MPFPEFPSVFMMVVRPSANNTTKHCYATRTNTTRPEARPE
jgi:hypothetical protein